MDTAHPTIEDPSQTLTVPFASLRVEGPDAFTFLQGQVTNDLTLSATKPNLLAAVCGPDGKLITIVSIQQLDPETFQLITYQEHLVALADRLQRFKIRVRADLTEEQTSWRAQVPVGDSPLWPFSTPMRAGSEDKDPTSDFRRQRLLSGAIHLPTDAPTDLLVAGVPKLVELGVSFTKGCYVGQELVARTNSRGAKPPISLFSTSFTTPDPEVFTLGPHAQHTLQTSTGEDAGEVRDMLVAGDTVFASGWVKRRFVDTCGLMIDGDPTKLIPSSLTRQASDCQDSDS